MFSSFCTRVPTERELHKCEKLFFIPDSSDWNPHCQCCERNELSMLDFEGNISESYHRSIDQVAFENENEDVTSELDSTIASITASE